MLFPSAIAPTGNLSSRKLSVHRALKRARASTCSAQKTSANMRPSSRSFLLAFTILSAARLTYHLCTCSLFTKFPGFGLLWRFGGSGGGLGSRYFGCFYFGCRVRRRPGTSGRTFSGAIGTPWAVERVPSSVVTLGIFACTSADSTQTPPAQEA